MRFFSIKMSVDKRTTIQKDSNHCIQLTCWRIFRVVSRWLLIFSRSEFLRLTYITSSCFLLSTINRYKQVEIRKNIRIIMPFSNRSVGKMEKIFRTRLKKEDVWLYLHNTGNVFRCVKNHHITEEGTNMVTHNIFPISDGCVGNCRKNLTSCFLVDLGTPILFKGLFFQHPSWKNTLFYLSA